jgi:hypothetical protein
MAMRKATTRRPEITPIKMERTRNRRSSRVGAILSRVADRLGRGWAPSGGLMLAEGDEEAAETPGMPASEGVVAAASIGGSGIYSCSTAAGF